MNVSFECSDKINGQLTIVVEEQDFNADVEKQLKNISKNASMPGFRPGKVPVGLIRRKYGTEVKMDVLNKKVGEQINTYAQENNIQILGSPLASEKQEPIDLEKPAPYTFMFDLAIAPEFTLELTEKDTIDFLKVNVDDKMVDDEVKRICTTAGKNQELDTYEEKALVKGTITQLDENGNAVEGGLNVENAIIMPRMLKKDDDKKIFEGVKKNDIITINPYKIYDGNEAELMGLLKIKREEVANYQGDFNYQITSMSKFVEHELDQELFDNYSGEEGAIKTEEEFRARVKEVLQNSWNAQSEFEFSNEIRKYCLNKVGELKFPEELLYKIIKQDNKDLTEEKWNDTKEQELNGLKWMLLRNRLAEQFNIQLSNEDIAQQAGAEAAAFLAQYGMQNDENLVNMYKEELLKDEQRRRQLVDSAVAAKLTEAVKNTVKLNEKTVTVEEFGKAANE